MNRIGVTLAAVLMALATSGSVAAQHIRDNQERVPPGEAEATQKIVSMIEQQVSTAYAGGQRPAMRDAHAKAHGCVRATVTVRPGLPKQLRQGIFAKQRSYRAWVRFSNGNGTPRDDHAGDGRGMAIKVMGVPGKKLLPDEPQTQDFLMINYPVFFTRNAADYVVLNELEQQNKAAAFFQTRPHERQISEAITAKVVDSVFEQRYFSMTPYLLGKRYIKFSAIPVSCGSGSPLQQSKAGPPLGDPNYLRTNMIAWLHEKDACFNLAVQPQTEPAIMPIEDPTIEWDESKAPFIMVATIRIPEQTFDSTAQQTFCENLSYSPWHALPAHRPVGGINRVRKVVYEKISELRHSLNKAPRAEPTGNETFQ